MSSLVSSVLLVVLAHTHSCSSQCVCRSTMLTRTLTLEFVLRKSTFPSSCLVRLPLGSVGVNYKICFCAGLQRNRTAGMRRRSSRGNFQAAREHLKFDWGGPGNRSGKEDFGIGPQTCRGKANLKARLLLTWSLCLFTAAEPVLGREVFAISLISTMLY